MLERTTALLMCQGEYKVDKSKAGLEEGEMNHSGLAKHAKLPKSYQFTVLIKLCFFNEHWVFSDFIWLWSKWVS